MSNRHFHSTAITVGAVCGAVANIVAFGVTGLTGIFAPLFLVSGPAALALRRREPGNIGVVLLLACLVYGGYAGLLARYGRRALVWLIVFHGVGASLAILLVGP
ncbi:MAG TPA: hypothetical protein VH475_06245 [Tepidisphaeraceae bacterium]|jgi:hypothetical protein